MSKLHPVRNKEEYDAIKKYYAFLNYTIIEFQPYSSKTQYVIIKPEVVIQGVMPVEERMNHHSIKDHPVELVDFFKKNPYD